jgi:ABC-type Fe3+ transport system substrate-binding protein
MGRLYKQPKMLVSLAAAAILLLVFSQKSWGASQDEWKKLVEAGKKEGKVVVSIPASSELRKNLEGAFEKQFPGIDLELFPSSASKMLRRISDEFQAGVRYFDIHIGGAGSMINGFVGGQIVDPIEPNLVLPEVKEPKNWWGGYMAIDKEKRFTYTFSAFLVASFWHNTKSVNAEELRSYDDLLNPKWKGKIGWYDPRRPGAGAGVWEYMWKHKGEEYLKRLVTQDLQLSRNQRVLAESLAREKLAVTIGVSYYSFRSFVEAGLPVKALPIFKEGTYGTAGSGNLAIIKNHPHPNATKVFVNWLLGKEGQEVWTKSLSQPTRRRDVDTQWTANFGSIAAKDNISLEQWNKVEQISADNEASAKEATKSARSLLPN